MFEIERLSKNNKLIAGTRWEILEPDGDYPSADYKLQYIFRNSNGVIKEYLSVSENGHKLVISAEDTALLQGGYYTVLIKAISLTNQNIIHPVYQCIVYVSGDLLTSSDGRSFYLKMVEKLETVLLSLADKTMNSVSIDGVSYNYNDIDKIENLLQYYKYKAGIKDSRLAKNILITFKNQ